MSGPIGRWPLAVPAAQPAAAVPRHVLPVLAHALLADGNSLPLPCWPCRTTLLRALLAQCTALPHLSAVCSSVCSICCTLSTAPSAALGGAVDVEQLVEFVDAGHDLLLAVDSGVSEELRALADQLGVDVDAS